MVYEVSAPGIDFPAKSRRTGGIAARPADRVLRLASLMPAAARCGTDWRRSRTASPRRRSRSKSSPAHFVGDDTDPALFAQGVKVAENEMELRAIRAQQVAVIERLREPHLVPFVKKDNTLQLGLGKFMEGWLAEWEIEARLPKLLEKYKDQMPPPPPYWDGFVPERLKELLEEPDYIDEETRERARKQIEKRDQIEQRDEYVALEAAIGDLVRLDRYQRRAWARQKRAIRQFVALSVCRNSHI